MMSKEILGIVAVVALFGAAGCASKAGNVALGAGAVGAAGAAAYEHQNKKDIEQLDRDLASGKISQQEHDRLVNDIKRRSITQ